MAKKTQTIVLKSKASPDEMELRRWCIEQALPVPHIRRERG